MASSAIDLLRFTRPELVLCPLPATDVASLLRAFAERLRERGLVSSSDEVLHRLLVREELASTGIGAGVAVPHCKVADLREPILSIGLVAKTGIDFKAVDGLPVRLFFAVFSPQEAPAAHLQVLAAVSRWVKSGPVERMLHCKRPESLLAVLAENSPAQEVVEGSRSLDAAVGNP